MDELVAKVAAATDIDPATARKAVVIILQFLANAGPKDKVDALVDQLPGARAAIGNGGGPSDIMGAFTITPRLTRLGWVATALMAIAVTAMLASFFV